MDYQAGLHQNLGHLFICPESLGKGLSFQICKMGAQTCTSQY